MLSREVLESLSTEILRIQLELALVWVRGWIRDSKIWQEVQDNLLFSYNSAVLKINSGLALETM